MAIELHGYLSNLFRRREMSDKEKLLILVKAISEINSHSNLELLNDDTQNDLYYVENELTEELYRDGGLR